MLMRRDAGKISSSLHREYYFRSTELETKLPSRKPILIWLIVSQVLALASLVVWLLLAGLSVMAFDSGGYTGSLEFCHCSVVIPDLANRICHCVLGCLLAQTRWAGWGSHYVYLSPHSGIAIDTYRRKLFLLYDYVNVLPAIEQLEERF